MRSPFGVRRSHIADNSLSRASGKRYVRQSMPVYGHHMLKAYTELPAAMITN
jgi:hypothetical protein